MNRRHVLRHSVAVGLLLSPLPRLSRVQTARGIRLVVPFTPGGSTDILARALAPKLQQALGVNVHRRQQTRRGRLDRRG